MRRRTAAVVASCLATLGAAALLGAAPASAAPTAPAAAPAASAAPVVPVARVDLNRYAGTWYQLAAVRAIYEVQCSRNVKARYTLNTDGTMAVRNTCTTWINTVSSVDGTARSDNAPRNSALTVSFFSLIGTPVYFSTSNYLVFGLDAGYRWALVGSADHRSGFVLSRTPTLPAADVARIRALIVANGYDLCQFRYTAQDGGQQSRGPVC